MSSWKSISVGDCTAGIQVRVEKRPLFLLDVPEYDRRCCQEPGDVVA
jgi:hypothetical protein